jgi:hypothetical protein
MEVALKKTGPLFALILAATTALPASAQEVKPINLALITPIQIVPKDQSVGAFRASLIYGRNVDVKFVDLGLIMKTDRTGVGFQWGLAGIGHDFSGLQWTAVGYNTGTLKGVQLGAVNFTGGPESGWVQCCGIFNGANDFEGLQFSVVNYAKQLKGLQLGLINIITEGGFLGLPVFPFFNFNFGD